MFFASVSGFVGALCMPLLCRGLRGRSTLIAALLPLGLALWFALQAAAVAGGATLSVRTPWIEEIGLELAFRLDGLSLLFAMLISGIGALVVLYTHGYLHDHPHAHRFVMFTLMFMSSMLGVVLANNVLLLFVFWELTSFTSYLLIGFNHDREEARKAALQALLVTGLGGLAMLAGLIMLAQISGTYDLSGMVATREAVITHAMFPAVLGLILLGAFTKSAQFPFHFWLPNAMQAPTPASAYLHSSTMVKAGVYLLARLHPVLGQTPEWVMTVTVFGAITMLTGAVMASGQLYLKRLLAYTTVAALGAMVMALGIGTAMAVKAAMVFLLAHALYKAALFLVAGAIDHQTGEKDVTKLGGLFRRMPLTALAAMVAGASMAGLPLTFGFIGKEVFYTALMANPVLAGFFLVSGALFVLVAFQAGIRPFLGRARAFARHPREAPASMTSGPLLLGLMTLAIGVVPSFADGILTAAATAVSGAPLAVRLHLWHGFNHELALSGATLLAGAVAAVSSAGLIRTGTRLAPMTHAGPDSLYRLSIAGLNALAQRQTRLLQSGSLRRYLMITILTLASLFAWSFVTSRVVLHFDGFTPVSASVALLCVLIVGAAIAATASSSRLGAVAAMGVVGFGVALLFIFYGAPDLAMTQLVVETLSVVLLVSAFYHLPPFTRRSSWQGRARDLSVAIFAGVMVTLLTLAAAGVQLGVPISDYFVRTSVPLGHGRNIVNVILIDYRGLDTLGEITVLSVAGLGALALLRMKSRRGDTP